MIRLPDGIVIKLNGASPRLRIAALRLLVIGWYLSTLWVLAVFATAARWSLRQRHGIHLGRIARRLCVFRRRLNAGATRRLGTRRHAYCPGLSLLVSGAPPGATGI